MLDRILEEIDILHELRVRVPAHGNLIPHSVVLNHITQRDSAAMGADRDAKFCRHENNRHDIIDPGHPHRIDLAVSDPTALEQLLENYG